MPGRFNLGPLVGGVSFGLKKRRPVGNEPADLVAWYLLLGVPAIVAIISLGQRIVFPSPQDLLAGLALIAGANLAAFALIAGWRERLNQRNAKIDGRRKRALDEAVAHILLSIVLATIAMASMILLTTMEVDSHTGQIWTWVARALTAIGLSLLTYISLTIIIVVNLLWDGYSGANDLQP